VVRQFDRVAYDGGAWWLVLTAQWVHFGWLHAGANVLAAGVLLLAFRRLVDGRVQAVALVGGYVGVAVVLVLDTGCTYYAGASGALHGLLAGSALGVLLSAPQHVASRTRSRWVGAGLLAGLVAKLLFQRWNGEPAAPGWLGMATYYPAHEAGALGGLLAVLLVHVFLGWRLAQPGSR
jgi:rhomboid family GlyGly-CTERM serine protease